MDENSNTMGDDSPVEPQVHGQNNEISNPGVSKVVAAAKLIKNLSQSSIKNISTEDTETENKRLEKQGSTDSAKELSKAIKAAAFVRTLSKQSIENGNKMSDDTDANTANVEKAPGGGSALAKATKAAKMIRQLSKTAMLVSSNTPSIDEAPADNESGGDQSTKAPASKDISSVVSATQLIKRISEQSIEKEKSSQEDDQGNKVDEDEDQQEKERVDENDAEDAGDKEKDDVETASHDAVLGDDEAPEVETVDEGFNSDEPVEESLKDKDPTKVAKAAALVRQLSRHSVTRTGSAGSLGSESTDGEKAEGGRKFKGRKFRTSVRDRSRETSLEVQEKIVESPEKETDITEQPEAEREEAEKEINENNKTANSEEVIITKQPSAAVDVDGDAIKTIESAEIDKPKTGFCPCL